MHFKPALTHKYDPIPQRDYYRLVATLTPAFDPHVWLAPNFFPDGVGAKWDDSNTRFLPLLVAHQREGARKHNESKRRLKNWLWTWKKGPHRTGESCSKASSQEFRLSFAMTSYGWWRHRK